MTVGQAVDLNSVADDEASKCGTYAGVQQHRLRKEPACGPCREAQREYMRGYRDRKGPGYDRWWNSTHDAALRLLAAEYPGRFAELLIEVRRQSPETPWDPAPTDSRPT